MRFKRHSKSRNGTIKSKFNYLLIAMVLVIVVFVFFWVKSFLPKSKNSKYDSIIRSVAKQYSIDPLLVKAVIWRESDFNSDAVGSKGEIGLMQLMMKSSVKDWANYNKRRMPEKGVVFNPYLNIEIGTWYLAWCRKLWGGYGNREALALATYNAGYSNVKKWIPKNYQNNNIVELIKFPSTKKYVSSIMAKYQKYKGIE